MARRVAVGVPSAVVRVSRRSLGHPPPATCTAPRSVSVARPRSVARVVIVRRHHRRRGTVVPRVEWRAARRESKRVVRHDASSAASLVTDSPRSPCPRFRRRVLGNPREFVDGPTFANVRGRVRCVRVRKGKGGNKFTRDARSIARCIVPQRTTMTTKTRRRRRTRRLIASARDDF